MNRADVPNHHRAYRNPLLQWIGRTVLQLMGWTVEGAVPTDKKLIIAAAPHTSNWDFVVGLSMLLAMDINIHWIGKETIFKKPFRKLLISLGGIPIDRSKPAGLVNQVVGQIRTSDAMMLGITPEGTRSKVSKWKSGFLRIAKTANCRVMMAVLDYGNKRILLGETIEPQENYEQQIDEIKAYFRQFRPKRPENF